MRPELLDKGMIKDRVKAMIIGDQNAAALAQEIAQEIAQEMGIIYSRQWPPLTSALGIGTGEGAGGQQRTSPRHDATGRSSGRYVCATAWWPGFDASGMTAEIVAKIDVEFGNPKNWSRSRNRAPQSARCGVAGSLRRGRQHSAGAVRNPRYGLVPFILAAMAARARGRGRNVMAITTPVLGGTTMPQVGHDGYNEELELRGSDVIMATGAMATDLVQAGAKRKFELQVEGAYRSAGYHHQNGMGNGLDGFRVVHHSPRRHVHGDA